MYIFNFAFFCVLGTTWCLLWYCCGGCLNLISVIFFLTAVSQIYPVLFVFRSLPLDHVFLCFAPSVVAAACVATSRLILHLSPTWPPRLHLLTGYSWESLIPCTDKLLMCVPVKHLTGLAKPFFKPSLIVSGNVISMYVWSMFLGLHFSVHMTMTSKRPTSRSASSPGSNSRGKQCTTHQARQQLWPSTCTIPPSSTPSKPSSRACPPTTGLLPTSATPLTTCRLPPALSSAPARSLPHWSQSPTFLTGLTKSTCTTPVLLRALTDDGYSLLILFCRGCELGHICPWQNM